MKIHIVFVLSFVLVLVHFNWAKKKKKNQLNLEYQTVLNLNFWDHDPQLEPSISRTDEHSIFSSLQSCDQGILAYLALCVPVAAAYVKLVFFPTCSLTCTETTCVISLTTTTAIVTTSATTITTLTSVQGLSTSISNTITTITSFTNVVTSTTTFKSTGTIMLTDTIYTLTTTTTVQSTTTTTFLNMMQRFQYLNEILDDDHFYDTDPIEPTMSADFEFSPWYANLVQYDAA